MAQVKKEDIREAILVSAIRLFGRHGYTGTSMATIAKGAAVSTANIYVYFPSKLSVLFAIYDPWLRERIVDLREQINDDCGGTGGHRCLHTLLTVLWQDIPRERNGFANNLIQALSSELEVENYSPDLFEWLEKNISQMIFDALPPDRRKALSCTAITDLILMAFDGFVINFHLKQQQRSAGDAIDLLCHLLMGTLPKVSRPRKVRPSE